MHNEITVEKLAAWIDNLMKAAKEDLSFSIDWYSETADKPFSIIGGWRKGFTEDYSDIFCISKSQPEYAMSVKIVANKGPYAYTDFEVMDMPIDKYGEVDDTCITLEWNDDPEAVATFFFAEWERIMEEHVEEMLND